MVFTDEPEIEEEKETPVAAAGVPEVENGFSDGENVRGLVDNDTAAENINQGKKHTVRIQNVDPFPIERQTIVDIINNHDGTVTIGVDPDVYIGDQKDTGKYTVRYYQESVEIDGTYGKNPESKDTSQMQLFTSLSVPADRKIEIAEKYITIYLCCKSSVAGYYYTAAAQENIVNPTKVVYDLDGGTDGPPTDWVWSRDCQWGNGHEKNPQKTGYRFDGWYTGKNGQGKRIDSVQDISYSREITLYAKWVHVHSWNYSLSGDTLKAYCSNTNSKCEYYGTGSDNAKATVSLKLNGFDNNNCAEYGRTYSVTCDNTFPSETRIESVQYVGRDGTTYTESLVRPTSTGKYKAKVNITLPGEQDSRVIYTDFEIKPLPAQLDWSSSDLTYNGEDQIVTAEVRNALPGDRFKLAYETNKTYTNTGKDAREYTLKAVVEETANYVGASATCGFKVKKAGATDSHSKVDIEGWTYGSYDEKKNAPSVDKKLNPENQPIQYTYYTNEACTTKTSTKNGAETEGGVPKNAGTYYVRAQISASGNYNEGTATGSFEIKSKEVTVKPDDLQKHIGEKDPKLTYTTDGIVEGETLSGITLKRESGEDARKPQATR